MSSKVKNILSEAHFDTISRFGNFSKVPFKVFDIVFIKNSILSFLEPSYVVDLVAAVRLLSKSNQVLHSKPLW